MSKFYYAVRVGKKPGIYKTWEECENQVKGFKGAKYKKFKTKEEANEFMEDIETEASEKQTLDLKDKEIIAYVDGSFSLDKMTFSYGVVLITKQGIEEFKGKDDHEELASMRNVSGELKGAMVAMDLALDRGMEVLYLHYDYAGIEEWALGRWKTNKEGTQKYKEYYDSIKGKLRVVFVKVEAHTGVEYNERADKLAKEALL